MSQIPLRRKRKVKKIACAVDNFNEYSERCVQLYHDIREHLAAGYSKRAIAKKLHCSRNTGNKYEQGDFEPLCRKIQHSTLEKYFDFIIKSLKAGMSRKDVYRSIKSQGHTGGQSAAYEYMNKLIERYNIEVSIYKSSSVEELQEKKKLEKYDHLTRSGIFRYLWMGVELTPRHKEYIFDQYPVLKELHLCIREFRQFFEKHSMPRLYLYIEIYQNSEWKNIAKFAKGLSKDLSAVENAAASDLSNGFVEGTNNKLKMLKRIMYGRCSKDLLAAKMMYVWYKIRIFADEPLGIGIYKQDYRRKNVIGNPILKHGNYI